MLHHTVQSLTSYSHRDGGESDVRDNTEEELIFDKSDVENIFKIMKPELFYTSKSSFHW